MKWKRFLKDTERATHFTLVGPLYQKRHVPETPTIYVDGGAHFRELTADDHYATVCVGDGDSGDASLLHELLPKEKDYSDLSFVLRNLPPTVLHVDLLGFLGGRRDHEIINFGEIHHYLTGSPHFRSVRFDDLVIAFCGGKLSIEIHGRFSVMCFESTVLTMTGACKFTVDMPGQLRAVSSHGLSNEGFGQIIIDSLNPCFVFLG